MKEDWEYNIFDHNWNNLKRWVECCEQRFGKEGLIEVGKMGDMMRTIQKMKDMTNDAILGGGL